MKQNKIHSTSEDFRRYLENEMSEPERNQFERQLEKDAFAKEAMEGFSKIPHVNFQKDLDEIKTKLKQPKKKNTFKFIAAAASILLLVTSGIIWRQINQQNALPEVVENKTQNLEKSRAKNSLTPEILHFDSVENEEKLPVVEDQIAVPQKEDEAIFEKDETPKKKIQTTKNELSLPGIIDDEIQVKPSPETVTKAGNQKSIRIRGVSSINRPPAPTTPFIAENQKRTATKIISGKIVEAGSNQPIPGVSIVEKSTQNGTVSDIDGNFRLELQDSNSTVIANFVGMEKMEINTNNDSDIVLHMQPSQIGLSEVVSIGYGKPKKLNQQPLVIEIDRPAQPIIGMKKYEEYLTEKAKLPSNYPKKKERVEIKFEINEYGETIHLQNLNQADSLIFEQAKQLISTGPMWQAEIKNGKEISSEKVLKITFRK